MFLKVSNSCFKNYKYCEQNQPIIAFLPNISLWIISIAGQPSAMVPSQRIFLGKTGYSPALVGPYRGKTVPSVSSTGQGRKPRAVPETEGKQTNQLYPRSRVRPLACGLGPCSRPRAQFFPIRTSQPVNNLYISCFLRKNNTMTDITRIEKQIKT